TSTLAGARRHATCIYGMGLDTAQASRPPSSPADGLKVTDASEPCHAMPSHPVPTFAETRRTRYLESGVNQQAHCSQGTAGESWQLAGRKALASDQPAKSANLGKRPCFLTGLPRALPNRRRGRSNDLMGW